MFQSFSYLAILMLLPIPTEAANHGTFTVFRWNQGYRADTNALIEKPITEVEFRALVKNAQLPEHDSIYRGCYLVNYQPQPAGRLIASETKPVSETYRICVPGSTQASSLP